MSLSKFSPASRASVLLAKKTDLNYQPVGFPDSCVDFVNSFKASSAVNIKLADTYVVDIFTNFQPIVMYIEYHCAQTVNELDGHYHAKVTLPTYIMYCLSLVYGHFLLCDMYVCPTSSHYAMDYFNVPDKKRFADFLLSVPVPTFLQPILTQMFCTAVPHTQNVVFCPSAAGVTFETHFGRFFPINMSSSIHDMIANTNARMTPQLITACLHSRILFTAVNQVDRHAFHVTIANLLGSI
jgi:hypothetical protein